VEIHEDDGRFFAQALDFVESSVIGVFQQLFHERASLQIDNCHLAFGSLENDAALAGHTSGVVERAEEARFGFDKRRHVFLVPRMVARGDDRDAATEEFDGEAARDAFASGGVFAIGDYEIDMLFGEGFFYESRSGVAPRFADDVS